jgi:endonuclease/exonuclease/phosphatase family metal-dependent hydrolase
MYKSVVAKRSYWNWLEPVIQRLYPKFAVIIGDLNLDPQRLKSPGSDHLRRLAALGWQLPNPAGRWSYVSPSEKTYRLDHALVSPNLQMNGAKYVVSAHGCNFAGQGWNYLSDHAPLVLDVALP